MSAAESFPREPVDAAAAGFSARDALLGWMQAIAPYGIFTTDAELRIQSWNQWLAQHSGLPAEKVVGQSLFQVFPNAHTRRFEEHFRRALAGEISMLSTGLHKYLLPLPVASGDFDVPYMLQTVRIAPLPAGELVVGTITIIEDVTQRECQAAILHRQQERDRLLSEALGVLLRSSNPLMDVAALFPKIAPSLGLEVYSNYLFDAESQTLRLNASGGIPPKQKDAMSVLLLGEGLSGLVAERRTPLCLADLEPRPGAPAQAIETAALRAYCCFPLEIGERLVGTLAFGSYSRETITTDEMEFLATIGVYVAIAIDRALRENALHLAQRSLLEHADNLEAKVVERTARLHETIAQLESFSYTVAHDLRAPIRSLKGYCEILLSDYTLPPEGNVILGRLQRASNRLDALTRDLLHFTKIARQDVQLEPVDVAELVHELLLTSTHLQDGVVVLQPPFEKAWGQRTLLQQCLSNLFDNAVKFARPGVPPKIIVRMERRRGPAEPPGSDPGLPFNPPTLGAGSANPFAGQTDLPNAQRVRIWIEDNGIGIVAEAHDKIFGIFERVSGLDHIEGTGIGLAIVARAMEQMGGACGVESTLGSGSRFWLELAAADGPAPSRRTK